MSTIFKTISRYIKCSPDAGLSKTKSLKKLLFQGDICWFRISPKVNAVLKSLKANTKYVCPGRDFWSSIRRRRERGGRDALGRHAGLSNRQDKPPAEIQTEDLYFQKFSIPCISSDILTYLLRWWLILREGLQNIIQVISSILEGKTISNTTFFVSFHSSSNNIVCSRPHLSVSECDQSRPPGRALLTVFSSRSFLTRNHRTVGELGGTLWSICYVY